ncbi:MAG: hypothetical protein PVJ40_01610 [Gammaproteobacteria bacterium]|jgi:heme-degrading monooxygenase HmoA
MILREWRDRIPSAKADAYLDVLRSTGLRDLAATPGNRGNWVLYDRGPDVTEVVLVSLWDSEDSIRAFAGDDFGKARYYPEDDGYLIERPDRLRHYEVAATS